MKLQKSAEEKGDYLERQVERGKDHQTNKTAKYITVKPAKK